jgi:hypothetical protein
MQKFIDDFWLGVRESLELVFSSIPFIVSLLALHMGLAFPQAVVVNSILELGTEISFYNLWFSLASASFVVSLVVSFIVFVVYAILFRSRG